MTQEEKQLLLKDLCSRLPYRQKGVELSNLYDPENISINGYDRGFVETFNDEIPIEKVRLYLRPMSSMTEEEKKEFDEFCVIDEEAWKGNGAVGYANQAQIMNKAIDWLNAHHFDYRGLIEKGLAIEAPEGMYNTKIK